MPCTVLPIQLEQVQRFSETNKPATKIRGNTKEERDEAARQWRREYMRQRRQRDKLEEAALQQRVSEEEAKKGAIQAELQRLRAQASVLRDMVAEEGKSPMSNDSTSSRSSISHNTDMYVLHSQRHEQQGDGGDGRTGDIDNDNKDGTTIVNIDSDILSTTSMTRCTTIQKSFCLSL
ncbi:hypothetical protein PTSG_03072 [Salpingoeca rosetta]|uniref:Uncharacterized protein n=1 Tax=Salpingoeca rosetta (strain ATCC 50818 / BSB-021) TaxID=946362 RepID=F2U461_SALR5|nr:uncharacterized protein PTSG_03072 [Salpingoeca rosetta]EGD82427.1 hypothetical protein PTSG_03072 [Salpingoeca rosetta]|eukprot:XP_004995663.1 hypothetical protein PTSG_03072 [Salpingoeca rosetta]